MKIEDPLIGGTAGSPRGGVQYCLEVLNTALIIVLTLSTGNRKILQRKYYNSQNRLQVLPVVCLFLRDEKVLGNFGFVS